MGKIMINNTPGNEDVERTSHAFVMGKTALNYGQEVTVLLTIEGVRVATKGYSDGLQAHGFDPLCKLVRDFVEGGGRVWVCGACAKPSQITDAELVPGAQIVGAESAVELMVTGEQTLSF